MQTSLLFTLLLGISLSIPAALADTISVPDTERRKGMSYDEYSSYREKMRMHMEKKETKEQHQIEPETRNTDEPNDPAQRNSTYGQGYQSRTAVEGKPDTSNRPERPQVERFNRGDMGRR